MNRDSILAMIAAQPDIRTVEIADALNGDMAAVDHYLADDLDSGAVIATLFIAPNGKKQFSYRLAPDAVQPAVPPRSPTKPELAIACITACGSSVTSAQLHAALGLQSGRHALQFLRHALLDGRLARDGALWQLGPALVPATDSPPATPEPVPVEPVSVPTTTGASLAPVLPPTDALPPVEFACALWSDGALQLTRAGATAITLSAGETQALRRYLALVA